MDCRKPLLMLQSPRHLRTSHKPEAPAKCKRLPSRHKPEAPAKGEHLPSLALQACVRFCCAGAISLLAGLLGCVPQATLQQVAAPPSPVAAEKARDTDGPKRTPKPATCVAFGNFMEREAAQKKGAPLEQERMRDQARRAYQEALQIDPTYLPAYLSLGQLYVSLGDYPRAVTTYQQG